MYSAYYGVGNNGNVLLTLIFGQNATLTEGSSGSINGVFYDTIATYTITYTQLARM
jgi:hypothetical protein